MFSSYSSTISAQISKIFNTHYYDKILVSISSSRYSILNYLDNLSSFYLRVFRESRVSLIYLDCYSYCCYKWVLWLVLCDCWDLLLLLKVFLVWCADLLLAFNEEVNKKYTTADTDNVPKAAKILISCRFIKSTTTSDDEGDDGCFIIYIVYNCILYYWTLNSNLSLLKKFPLHDIDLNINHQIIIRSNDINPKSLSGKL